MKAPLAQMTKAEILDLYRWRCSHGHNGISHYNCWQKEFGHEKLGFLDIETSNLKANFGIVLCWCIKPGGKRIQHGLITKDDLQSGNLDKRIVQECIDAMWGYNHLVGHYSTYFDIPFLRTRALSHGLEFPEYGELRHTDVWKMARKSLAIHSNRQDSVAEVLHGKTIKSRIDATYWIQALMGDEKSLSYILDHCKRDVKDLEKNYEKLVPFSRKSNTSI